ncbi:MAG: hypothetical protein M0D57_20890 [Sphingobacteriales bacterium JAD_PAG50586_3]|nr:MAG: hypothetical protein M0D57_20890 [Sphingobacteriales bacterium JAD_PAG50586_3]
MKSNVPLSMISADGALSLPMVAILNSAFDFSEVSLQHSRWVPYTTNWITRIPAYFSGIKQGSSIAAMVMGRYIIHNNNTDRSLNAWFALICHEQSHRSEVGLHGGLWFYIKYLLQSVRYKYRDIPTEVTAYSLQEKALQLTYANNGEVLNILESKTLTVTEKCDMLRGIGKRFSGS